MAHLPDEIRVHVVDYGRQALYMRVRDPVTGKQVTRSTGTRRRREAEKIAAQWEADLQHGRYKPPSKVTWAEFRQRFEIDKLDHMSASYAATMATTFTHLEAMGVVKLVDAANSLSGRFEQHLRRRKVKPSTIRSYLKHLRAAIGWARDECMLTDVPRVKLPKARTTSKQMKGRPVTAEEFERILLKCREVRAEAIEDWQDYLMGLWFSGLRLSESVRLSWDDDAPFSVDLSGRHPRFRIWGEAQKSGRDELLPMTPDCAEWLMTRTRNIDRVGPVFPLRGRRGKRLTANPVGCVVADIGRAANVVVDKAEHKFATCHDLRRSFGTRWATRVKPAVLQKLMRHVDIETTMKFYVAIEADDVADGLWREFGGNYLGNTPPKVTQARSPRDVATSRGQRASSSRDDRIRTCDLLTPSLVGLFVWGTASIRMAV